MTDLHIQHGVDQNCQVTAQTPPNMTVAVAAGSVIHTNTEASVSLQNVAITTADATHDRYDLISVDNTGTVSVTAGVADGTLTQPDNADVKLAHVYVYSQANANYTGTITSGAIQDIRTKVLRHQSPYRVSGLWYGAAGAGTFQSGWADGDMYLVPLFVGRTFAVQAIGCRTVAPAATAGSKGRFGIYSDDGAGTLSLLVDAGQVAIDGGASAVSTNISVTLSPGWWWLAMAFQNLGATKPNLEGINSIASSPVGSSSLISAASGQTGYIRFSGISGSLPSTPSSPDFSGGSFAPAVVIKAA